MSGKLYSKFDSIGKSHEIDLEIENITEAINTLQLITVETVDRYTKNYLNPTVEAYVALINSNIKFSSMSHIESNLNANLNRIRVASSVLRNVKDYMTECRSLATKASDETITASRRSDYQERIDSLIKKSLVIQREAKFNEMKIFDLGNFSTISNPEGIDIVANPSQFDALEKSWKAQIGFNSSDIFEYKIKSWGTVLKTPFLRAPCTLLKLWETTEEGSEDEASVIVDRYGKYIFGDYKTWAINILILYNYYCNNNTGLQGTFNISTDGFTKNSKMAMAVAFAARIVFGFNIERPLDFSNVHYLVGGVAVGNDNYKIKDSWSKASKNLQPLSNLLEYTRTCQGEPTSSEIGYMKSLKNEIITPTVTTAVKGDFVHSIGTVTKTAQSGNDIFSYKSSIMDSEYITVKSKPFTNTTDNRQYGSYVPTNNYVSIDPIELSNLPVFYSPIATAVIDGSRNIKKYNTISPWKIKSIIKKDSHGNMFIYKVYEKKTSNPNTRRKHICAVSITSIDTVNSQIQVNSFNPVMKLVGVRYTSAYATANDIIEPWKRNVVDDGDGIIDEVDAGLVNGGMPFPLISGWRHKNINDNWAPDNRYPIPDIYGYNDPPPLPPLRTKVTTASYKIASNNNLIQHDWDTWSASGVTYVISPWSQNPVTKQAPTSDPFIEQELYIDAGDIFEIDLTYPFYRLQITQLEDSNGDLVTGLGNSGSCNSSTVGDNYGKIYVSGLDLLPSRDMSNAVTDYTGEGITGTVDPSSYPYIWKGYHLFQHIKYHRNVVIGSTIIDADLLETTPSVDWKSPPFAEKAIRDTVENDPAPSNWGGDWTNKNTSYPVDSSGGTKLLLDWSLDDVMHHGDGISDNYIRIRDYTDPATDIQLKVGDVIVLGNVDHPWYDSGSLFRPTSTGAVYGSVSQVTYSNADPDNLSELNTHHMSITPKDNDTNPRSLSIRSLEPMGAGNFGFKEVRQYCTQVEHPHKYISPMSKAGNTSVRKTQFIETLGSMPEFVGATAATEYPPYNLKGPIYSPDGDQDPQDIGSAQDGSQLSWKDGYVWHKTSDKIRLGDTTGLFPGYILVNIETPNNNPPGYFGTTKIQHPDVTTQYVTKKYIEHPNWTKGGIELTSNIVVTDIDTDGIVTLSSEISHCYGKILTFVPHCKYWTGPRILSVKAEGTGSKLTLNSEIGLPNNPVSANGTVIQFTKASPSYVNKLTFRWDKLLGPWQKDLTGGGHLVRSAVSSGLLYNGYAGYTGDSQHGVIFNPNNPDSTLPKQPDGTYQIEGMSQSINNAINELYEVMNEEYTLDTFMGTQLIQSNSFTQQMRDTMIDYFFIDYFNYKGGQGGIMNIYDESGVSNTQPYIGMFALNDKIPENSIQIFIKQEEYISELLSELKSLYDYLDKQRLVIKDDYEATIKSLDEQKEMAKKSLNVELKALYKRIEYYNLNIGHRD